jgi:hypothetical protein
MSDPDPQKKRKIFVSTTLAAAQIQVSNFAWFLLPWPCMSWTDGSSVYFNHNIYLEYSNILNLIPAVAIAGIIETFA